MPGHAGRCPSTGLTQRGVTDSNQLPPGSQDAPERLNSNIAFAAWAGLAAGRPGMLWASVLEVGRTFASSCGPTR
jgi:hypothetical protein